MQSPPARLHTVFEPQLQAAGPIPADTWVVVLIKDFGSAKQRLSPALGPEQRRALARENASRALLAAQAADHVLAVCGSKEAAAMASEASVEVLLEDRPEGQNRAAERGLEHARRRGAGSVLVLSSDLPLIEPSVVTDLLVRTRELRRPLAVAVPATGRGGTNAVLTSPPGCVGLHFGDDSLARFELDARSRGLGFHLFESELLALDLDEPSDLAALAQR
ncbi:MAG TPA: 2-phospho-L-lactate guanylyltransferase [Candidatus Nitrosotalea sp.]|nr:2-phospho-L-lactate guanylyltransferase [Candidatus Nitrosotalea sp.]